MTKANRIKSIGYLTSTVSVLLLGIVSWKAAQESAFLACCLIGGMALSCLGMVLRWMSYQIEKG